MRLLSLLFRLQPIWGTRGSEAPPWEHSQRPRLAAGAVHRYFRADAAFARPKVYQYLEEHDFLFFIRLPSNDVLARRRSNTS